MKITLLAGLTLIVSACMPLHPKPVTDIQKECAEIATDEAMPFMVLVGPVTGNIVRSKTYKDCLKEK